MQKKILMVCGVLILLAAAQACVPGQPLPDDLSVINTAVAGTLAAATQTTVPGLPVTGDGSPTLTVTSTGIAESPTPTMTVLAPTATMTALSLTTATPILTPGVVQLYVSVPTNCRLGPSVQYTRVGGLQLGQVANVVGRNATGDYWIIRNPSRANENCWLWGQYATVVGDTSNLPVVLPPPLPTPVPGFDAALNDLESCPGSGWWLDIALENNGGITFQSLFMTLRDTDTGTELVLYQDNFIDRDGCNVQEDQGDLDPEDTVVVSSPAFSYDPAGHEIRTRITLCSGPGQSGTCLSESFDFTP